VEFVGTVTGDDVDGAGGSELCREVERGLADLEFLNGAGRDVLRGGTHGFVGDVHAVHFDTGRATEAAAEGDGGEPILGWVEVAAVLNLDAGFELSEVKELRPLIGRFSICRVA